VGNYFLHSIVLEEGKMKNIRFLKILVPPIFLMIFYKIKKMYTDSDSLFDGDDALFKAYVADACVYGEYGSGCSTSWVFENTQCDIYSVDTSDVWVKNVKKKILYREKFDQIYKRLNIRYVDSGEVGNWGRPQSYMQRDRFSEYTDYLWQQKKKPELVLIDGRFRVCCFLTALKYGMPGTKILFDDYINRPHYHFIEKYVQRESTCGRQALFIVPEDGELNFEELEIDISRFRYVMD
jgi:hypothetical protein